MDIHLSKFESFFRSFIQKYNHEKYWRYREIVINPNKGTKIGKLLRLLYIKRADAYNNASMGTHYNLGAKFAEPPQLPHGLNGIVLSHNVIVGKDCRIFHQVTIGEGRGGAPVIGDHVVIGAGCKIVGNVHIGNNVKIAPGCTIMMDIPDNSIVLPAIPVIKVKYYGETDE